VGELRTIKSATTKFPCLQITSLKTLLQRRNTPKVQGVELDMQEIKLGCTPAERERREVDRGEMESQNKCQRVGKRRH
jgi:hypothetical protein